jgi:hypothetical protein
VMAGAGISWRILIRSFTDINVAYDYVRNR